MGMSSAIQFRGKDNALRGYVNRGVEFWSLWQGKQFMFKGEGAEMLTEVLTALEEGGTAATYTLKVYEDVDEVGKIKGNTADDGSFNFKLDADGMGLHPGAQRNQNLLMETLSGIDKRLQDLEDREVEEPQSKLGIIGEIINNPAFASVLPSLLEKVLSFVLPNNNLNRMATISGLSEDTELLQVVGDLKKHDPDILIHLKKLLAIAETNNNMFTVLINSL